MGSAERHVFINGKIFTSNEAQPYASAMVVENGKICWIGNEEELEVGSDGRTDLKGRRVLPGLIDAHMHPFYLAKYAKQIACTPPITHSIEELKRHLQNKRLQQGPDQWIEGWGFDEGKLAEGRTPTRHDLDEAVSDAPVVISRTCTHIMVANSRALELAGINGNTPDPVGGKIDRDANGEPTGILQESAIDYMFKAVPSETSAEMAQNIAEISKMLLAHGLTTVTEMLARAGDEDHYDLFCEAREKGLKQRVVLYYISWDVNLDATLSDKKLNRESPVYVGGLKILADGSVSGRTAWVDPPYLGAENSYGMLTTSQDELLKAAAYAERNGIQLIVHAMGEQAIDLVVDTFYQRAGWLEGMPSVRIEHAAMPTKRTLERAAQSGIAFVTQPIFQYAEIESYIKNLGLERTQTTYPVQDMLKAGVQVAFSSDAPATAWADPSDPFVSMKAAVTRTSYDGTDCGQKQRVDIPTAIKLYTSEAQRISGIPKIGQLAVGYHADFIVLDQDLLEVNPEAIDDIKVEETYLGGVLVYDRRTL